MKPLRSSVCSIMLLIVVSMTSLMTSAFTIPVQRHMNTAATISSKYIINTYNPSNVKSELYSSNQHLPEKSELHDHSLKRRNFLQSVSQTFSLYTLINIINDPTSIQAQAYTPDPNPLRESLYLMSRVQEATVLQQRFVSNASTQQDLKQKMKLTLLLIEKNYRLVDQITYASRFIKNDGGDDNALMIATEAGNEAAEELQSAIDYVNNDLKSGVFTEEAREYLNESLKNCREKLFIFLDYMPKEDLEMARKRVEEENVLNREEFDGDKNAGVYNPIVLPWKSR